MGPLTKTGETRQTEGGDAGRGTGDGYRSSRVGEHLGTGVEMAEGAWGEATCWTTSSMGLKLSPTGDRE